MSTDKPSDDEMDRILNDPEYRKKIREQKQAQMAAFNLKKDKPSETSSTSSDSKPNFNLKKEVPEEKTTTPIRATTSSTGKIPLLAKPDSDKVKETVNKPAFELAKKFIEQKKSNQSEKVQKSPVFSMNNMLKWAAGIVLIGGAFGSLFLFYLVQGLPSISELENPKTDIASFVKSRDGETLDKYFTENRTYVSYEQISPHVINSLIAVEDHRFYEHWGIDLVRMLGLPYYWIRGDVQGGSTLTMQLARNLYKKIGRQFSIARKFREMITAIQIERSYTKREIVEMYLNTVEFSNSSFGIEAAALTHFGKNAKNLNVLESATLVGTLNAVTAYNPRLSPERSTLRRNTVLYFLSLRGFISSNEYQALKELPITLDYHPPFKTGRKSRYFGEYVRLKMEKWCNENGYDLYRDGLVIYTTIDSRFQKHAEAALGTTLDTLQKTFEKEWTSKGGEFMDIFWKKYNFIDDFIDETPEYKNGFFGYKTRKEVLDSLKKDKEFVLRVKKQYTKLQSGFTAIDPRNGHILAWVGGANFSNVQFDHVYQAKRQVGSTFKPFVYAVAIDNGYPPYFKLSKYPTKFFDRAGRVWSPRDESIPEGPEFVSLRVALARSMNNVTVRLLPVLAGNPTTNKLEDLYPAARKIVSFAKNMGITANMQPNPSIALGTAETSLLEMVSAYTTFANYGVHIAPLAITRIEDKEGNILAEYYPEYQKEVISPETAYIMIDMLRGVVRGVQIYEGGSSIATGIRLRNLYGVDQDVAAKTGTTQNSADNWFIAMMPHIVMGAWVGGEDRKIRFPSYPGYNGIGQGARTALPIVGEFIDRVKKDPNAPWSYDAFEQPKGFVMPEEPKEAPSTTTIKKRVSW